MSFLDLNFLKKLMMGCVMASTLKIPLSLVALLVKKIPRGTITIVEIQAPIKEEIELSSAKFLPIVFPKK